MRSLDVSHVLLAVDPTLRHWDHALDLARGLAAYGVRTTLAALRPPTESQLAAARAIEGLALRSDTVAGSQEWLLFLEGLCQPDLVQIFQPDLACMVWRAPVALALDMEMLDPMRGDEQGLRDAVRSSSLVIVPTCAALRELEAVCGPLPGAIAVPRGIAGQPTKAPRKRDYVAAVGAEQTPAGLPWRAVRLEEARDEGERQRWVRHAALVASLDLQDPCRPELVEAAQSGCALVLPDTEGYREVWERAAMFYDPAEGPVKALRQTIEDGALRRFLQLRARDQGCRFTERAMAQAFLFSYQETVQEAAVDLPVLGRFEML